MEVLVIEDNDGDRMLIMEAISDVLKDFSFRFKVDGEQASEYLSQVCIDSASSIPDLIILDINLPKKNGLEVLSEIRHNPNLVQVPVIIFSTSSSIEDVEKAQQLGIQDYVVKPIDFYDYQTAVKKMLQWVNIDHHNYD